MAGSCWRLAPGLRLRHVFLVVVGVGVVASGGIGSLDADLVIIFVAVIVLGVPDIVNRAVVVA
eukprot:10809760-Alexandrium_andersonii.AAC.1